MRLFHRLPGKLANKIDGILVAFFLFALTMIGLTLYVGRQLEGGAAAINEAGALRMRTYRIGYLLEQAQLYPAVRTSLLSEARATIEEFSAAIALIDQGDPDRPLFLPREEEVRLQMALLKRHWQMRFEPLLRDLLVRLEATPDDPDFRKAFARIDEEVRAFVPQINALVLLVEKSNARHTDQMWAYQNALVGFALFGTLVLIYLFRRLVIDPVEQLQRGMASMAKADFGVRLPVYRRDEFGELAHGFNHMADQLHDLYANLEQKVRQKTEDLAVRARELGLLYEVAAHLTESAELERMVQGVLERVRDLLGAEAWAVRLIDEKTDALNFAVTHAIPDDLLAAEAQLPLGICLCGKAALEEIACAGCPRPEDAPELMLNCYRQGLLAVVAIPVRTKNRILGIFNLFFTTARTLKENEIRLLEAVGRHLGVAIENLQLAEREKEMAVSEERNLLAQELHDSIAQSLAFLNIQAQMMEVSLRRGDIVSATEELARIREGVQESYDNVRELLVHFRIRVEHSDLGEAIDQAAQKFEGQTGILTRIVRHGEIPSLAPTIILQILHIVQEALSNVRKHAQAQHVTILLDNREEGMVVEIDDDGIGFSVSPEGKGEPGHVGIGIMCERAHRIKARCEVDSAPGAGTRIRLILPREER